jgi:hypothetical protein
MMERARATWTDERLDDLSRRMDQGFARVDEDLRSLRSDLGGRIDAQGAELSGRIDALQRTMLQIGGGIVAANLVTIVSLLVTRA